MTWNSSEISPTNSLCIAMIQIIIMNVLAIVQTWSNAHWIGSVIGFPCPVLSWFPPRALWVVETLHISCNSQQMSVRRHYWCVWALSRPRHINSILDLWSSGAPALVLLLWSGLVVLDFFSGYFLDGGSLALHLEWLQHVNSIWPRASAAYTPTILDLSALHT